MKAMLALLCIYGSAGAVAIDEAQLINVQLQGKTVYTTCIVTPPVTPHQVAVCTGLYNSYVGAQQALNAPLPLTVAAEPSPYVWSPSDVCKFETGHLAFANPVTQPFCPTTP